MSRLAPELERRCEALARSVVEGPLSKPTPQEQGRELLAGFFRQAMHEAIEHDRKARLS